MFKNSPEQSNYTTIVVITIFSSILILIITSQFIFTNNNSQQLISTIIQSLASILAILISLTLVAVQLAAQNYSKRILNKFISFQNKIFWITISIFLIGILYNIFLLNIIPNSSSLIFDLFLNISILLTIWCLILLPIYIRSTLLTLSPKKTIDDLLNDLNEEYIIKLIESDYKLEFDSFIPIIDIITHAINTGDFESVKQGFNGLNKQLNKFQSQLQQNPKSAQYILNNLDRLKNSAFVNSDIKSVGYIIDLMIDVVYPILRDFDSIKNFFILLRSLSFKIVETEADFEVENLLKHLNKFHSDWYFVQKYGVMRLLNNMWEISIKKMELNGYTDKIWIEAMDEESSFIESEIRKNLNHLMIKIGKEGLEYSIREETKFLANFGISLVKTNPKHLIKIISGLNTLFINFFSEGYENALKNPEILSGNSEEKIEKTLNNIVHALKYIGIVSIEENSYEYTITHVHDIQSLIPGEMIREDSVVISEIISSLNLIISYYLKDNDIDNIIKFETALDSLVELGINLVSKKSIYIENIVDILGQIIMSKQELNITFQKYTLNSLHSISIQLIGNDSKYMIHQLENLEIIKKYLEKNRNHEILNYFNRLFINVMTNDK